MHHGGRTDDKGPSASPPLNEDYLSTYKRRKITHACDYCRIKRTKCDSLKPQCSQCAKANVACTFLIRHKKRGPIPRDPYELRRVSDGDPGGDQGPVQSINTEPMDGFPQVQSNLATRDDIEHLTKAQTTRTIRLDSIAETSLLEITPASPPLRHYSIQEDTPCKEVSDHLIEIFFLYCYQDFEFLDPRSFLDEYSKGVVSPILLNAMFAVAARFSDHPQVVKSPQYLSGEPFAKYVRDRIMELIDEASLDHFHALLLISFFEYTTSRGARGWRFEGLACRMSLELLLHLQTTIPCSESGRVAFEVKYRSFYSVVLSDIISAANAGMPPVLVSKDYKFNIPEPDLDWWVDRQSEQLPGGDSSNWKEVKEGEASSPTLQNYYQEGILRRLREPKKFRGYGPARYVFRLAEILSRVSRYINGYTLDSDKRPSDPDSEFSILNDDLSSWLESIPPDLSPSGSPDKIFSFSSNSTFMALTFYMTVVLLHRPILALEELVDAAFLHRSSAQCTDVATKASQIIQQLDADTIKYRGHTFAYAVFTTATIHVTNAFSADEELARSAKRCLNYHLTFMKEANPYCAMAGRFYYVIQDLYSMQSKLHAAATPPVPQSARHVDTTELAGDGHAVSDQDHQLDFDTEPLSTPEPPCPVSPSWSPSRSPSISLTSTSSGRSRVLPVSSLLKSDSGLVGLWRRVDEMQALDTAAHSLRQLSLKSPQLAPPISNIVVSHAITSATSPTVQEQTGLRKDTVIAVSNGGPTMEDVIISGTIDNSSFKEPMGSKSPPTLNDLPRTIEITGCQNTGWNHTISRVIRNEGSTLPGNLPQESMDKKGEFFYRSWTSQGGTSDFMQRTNSYPTSRDMASGSIVGNSTTVERRAMDGMDLDQRDLDTTDIPDHGPSTCLLPSALPMNKPDKEEVCTDEKDERDINKQAFNAVAETSLCGKGYGHELTNVEAKVDVPFQEASKSGAGDKFNRDLRRRPYPPDRKPNRGGQGRPSQVRGRHHQHHEGPRLDLLADNLGGYNPLGLSEHDRIAEIDPGLPPEGKQWSSKLGMIFQYQRQVMSTRFQHAASHSPEPRSGAYPAPAPVSSQSLGLGLHIDSAAMAAPPRPELFGDRSRRRESAPARDSFRSPPSPTWCQGLDPTSHSTEMNLHYGGYYRGHAESGSNSSFDPSPNLPVNRTRSLEYGDNVSTNTSVLRHNIKSNSYSPTGHGSIRVYPRSSRESAERQYHDESFSQSDQHERYHGALWDLVTSESRSSLERSKFESSRLERMDRLLFDIDRRSSDLDFYPLKPNPRFARRPESPTRSQQQPRGRHFGRDREHTFIPPPPPLQMLRSIPLPPPLPSFQRSSNLTLADAQSSENYRRWSPSTEPVSPSPAAMVMSDQHVFEQRHSDQHRHPQRHPERHPPNSHVREHQHYPTPTMATTPNISTSTATATATATDRSGNRCQSLSK